MLIRLRRAWRTVAVAALVADWDKDDALILIGLALISAGLWRVWPPIALIVAGAVLLWVFLPSRPPFIDRPTATRERRP